MTTSKKLDAARRRTALRSQPHPSRPRVVHIGSTTAELAWDMPPENVYSIQGFRVTAQRGGRAGIWEVLVSDTQTSTCLSLVSALEPSSWYQFRVAAIYAHLGTGLGSPPSEPHKTLISDKRPVELRQRIVREGAPPLATGQTAAAALVVARGAETTPPLTEEESAQYAAALAHALSHAQLRKDLLEWDQIFEWTHGRVASNEERMGSPRRSAALDDYLAVKRERVGGQSDLEHILADVSENGGSRALGAQPAQSAQWGYPGGEALQIRAGSDAYLSAIAGGSGGAMSGEQRQLCLRLSAEARSLYVAALTQRCASLATLDALSALSSDMLESAIRLFGRFDDDVDGLLAPPEFAALFRFLEELESSDAGGGALTSGVDEGSRDWRVAFRRADLTSCGFIDLNALVLHMQRAKQLWVLRSALTKDHSRTTLSASGSQQKPRMAADSVIRAAGDSAMLADEEYMERLIEQAQSAKGAGFVLDRLDDHRLLLRAVRLFGRYDRQRKGTLDLFDVVTMLAPRLERSLARVAARETAQAGAQHAERERQRQPFSLGETYMLLAAEAAATPAKAATAPSTPVPTDVVEPTGGSPWEATPSSASKNLSKMLHDGNVAAAVVETVNQTAQTAAGALGKLGALPGLAVTSLHLFDRFNALDRALTDALCLDTRPNEKLRPRETTQPATPPSAVGVSSVSPPNAPLSTVTPSKATGEAKAASDVSEMATALKCGLAAVVAARALFTYADTTASGAVDFNEFILLLASGALPHVAEGGDLAAMAHEPQASSGQVLSSKLGAAFRQPLPVDELGRQRAAEAHRGRMVDRALERLGGSSAEVLNQVSDPAADEAVQLFARADADSNGVLTLAEFAQALSTASTQSSYSDGRVVGAMEARLWFASLDRDTQRGYVDVGQWIQLLLGGYEGAGRSGLATTVDALDPTLLRGVAGEAARIGHLQMTRDRPGGVSEATKRSVRTAIQLLEEGGAEASDGYDSPSRGPPRSPLRGKTAAAEAADDAEFAAKMARRFEESELRSTAEDERSHAYLSKVVAAAGAATALTDAGLSTLESFSSEHLSAALALYERYDEDLDGRLQPLEFERMLTTLSRQHGMRFSPQEVARLFRAADLSGRGSVNMLEMLLLLQQLALPPIAPADADAYRERLLQTAARSVVRIESEAAAARRHSGSTKQLAAVEEAASVEAAASGCAITASTSSAKPKKDGTSVLLATTETVDEIALLFGRFDGGRKGYLNFEEFAALKNALAVQSGGTCFTAMELRVLFSRADRDHSGTLDLNEVFLHLRSAHPSAGGDFSSLTTTSTETAASPANALGLMSRARATGATGTGALVAASEALMDVARDAEEARRVRVDELVEKTAPTLPPEVSRSFGEAELRALAALFIDLDHGGKGALRLPEFRVLLSMLEERYEERTKKESPSQILAVGATPKVERQVGLREAQAIFRQCDLDANGELSFAELLQLLTTDQDMSQAALAEGRSLRVDKARGRGGHARKKGRDSKASPAKGKSPKGSKAKASQRTSSPSATNPVGASRAISSQAPRQLKSKMRNGLV